MISQCLHQNVLKFIFKKRHIIFAGSKLIFLVVPAHGVVFPGSLFNWSFLTFTYSVFYLIKMFPVLNLNSKFFCPLFLYLSLAKRP
jgi:hypothetical protein